jgi:transposase
MGGCHEIVVCDNLRSGVTRPHRYEPDVNATYQEMAAHYGVAVIPTRTYKPRDKAKVEAGVLLAERWIIARLRHRHFTSLAAANVAIRECVAVINAKPFKKMDGSRAELFEQLDRPAIKPLPPTRYEFATFKHAKVNIDYHVELDRHYYSVPYQLVGKVVELRVTARRVARRAQRALRYSLARRAQNARGLLARSERRRWGRISFPRVEPVALVAQARRPIRRAHGGTA